MATAKQSYVRLTVTAEELDSGKTTRLTGKAKDVQLTVEDVFDAMPFARFDWVEPCTQWKLRLDGEFVEDYQISTVRPGADLSCRAQAVRDAWAKAQDDDLPQGFGWPGDLFDALEAL